MTAVPVGSRTTVQGQTQVGLTSGFGMGPGKHHRYDRAPTPFELDVQSVDCVILAWICETKGTRGVKKQ